MCSVVCPMTYAFPYKFLFKCRYKTDHVLQDIAILEREDYLCGKQDTNYLMTSYW